METFQAYNHVGVHISRKVRIPTSLLAPTKVSMANRSILAVAERRQPQCEFAGESKQVCILEHDE